MVSVPGFDLDSKQTGGLPIVNHFLRRIRADELFESYLPVPDPRNQMTPHQTLGVLLRNLILARVPLYALREWAAEMVPSLLGLSAEQVRLLNDDRVGRALDRLFDVDRNALLTELVVHVVQEFEVSLDQLHNDSTSLTLHGEYDQATGKLVRGKPTLVITHGHNKDHRPDLKQLLWILTVSADGAVPVHFKVADGNTEDSTTHVETWTVLRELVGSADFLYVADSKLCTRPSLKHIDDQDGLFITVLPRSRGEDKLFKDWLQEHAPPWEEVARRPHPRLKNGPHDIFRACESPIPDGDGYRLLWFESSLKMERDAQTRRHAIQSASRGLEQLQAKLQGPRSRLRKRAAVAAAADEILGKHAAGRWIDYEITSTEEPRFRQEKRGRPGKKTRWRRELKTRFDLAFRLRDDRVQYDARCDGIFPLITNSELSAADVLDAYKTKQPMVEKRHDLLKNVEAATPIFLKSISRIEALLFMHFVALLVHALIEREVRSAMRAQGIRQLPLYPESRKCKAPSTARILEVFGHLQRHLLRKRTKVVQRFDPELTPLQREILTLLRLPTSSFENL